jgi:hypothetical protein
MKSATNNHPAPAMSVIIVTRSGLHELHLNLLCLSAQTARDKLELILVAPVEDPTADDGQIPSGFQGVSVLRLAAIRSRGTAAAAAVREARGRIIALMENHVFPEPDWAEQILRAHEGPWSAVGPRIDTANPDSWTSRAYRLLIYGRLSVWDQPEETNHLPWHNTAYKREVLQPFLMEVGDWLDREGQFHKLLRAQGHRLYYWPAARLRHVNLSRFGLCLRLAFQLGRVFACDRAADWPWWRRAARALAWPLFLWIRLKQLWPDHRLIRRRKAQWFPMPLLVCALYGMAIGEAAGYWLGQGRSREWVQNAEFCVRERLNDRDLRQFDQLALGRAKD